jgi:hypothetical protein
MAARGPGAPAGGRRSAGGHYAPGWQERTIASRA